MPNDQEQQPDRQIMLALPQPILQGIINVIVNAPMGCGMTAAENKAYREMILQNAQLVGPQVEPEPESIRPAEAEIVDPSPPLPLADLVTGVPRPHRDVAAEPRLPEEDDG